ncbi:hypothetical protein [Yunchengibacter salinarum]|uniref:hypothetical protein n=1 Tax=Yunchengibacter salinarum TaxID=3133399 RepID=UPI0035B624CC
MIMAGALALSTPPASAQTHNEQTENRIVTQEIDCLRVSRIRSYSIESTRLVRLALNHGQDGLMQVGSHCGDLAFHGYFSFIPRNGRLCRRFDSIQTRSGHRCEIERLMLVPEGASVPESLRDPPPDG